MMPTVDQRPKSGCPGTNVLPTLARGLRHSELGTLDSSGKFWQRVKSGSVDTLLLFGFGVSLALFKDPLSTAELESNSKSSKNGFDSLTHSSQQSESSAIVS